MYDAMNSMPIAKELLSEIHHLLLLFLTIPVTTSTSEKTFLVLQMVKHISLINTTGKTESPSHLYYHTAMTDDMDSHKLL